VKVGVTIPALELTTRARRSLRQMAADAVEAERLGYDSVWVMDHVFTDREGVRTGAGPEPLTFLGFVAARTERVQLGTLVLCAAFRPPAQLAREAKSLFEASSGRFILGVGSGWHQPEFDAFGFPFDHLVGRFEDYLEVLTRLLGEGPGDYQGRHQVLRAGEVFGPTVPPPWIAASGPRMLGLTGRLAGGWNSAWHGSDPSLFSERLSRVEEALFAAGRSRAEMAASAGMFVLPLEGDELAAAARSAGLSREELEAKAVTGHPEAVVEMLLRYRAAGCDHLVLNFSTSPFRRLGESLAARLAPLLDRLR
jgi:alkanesulfonate monooxygenase SsuD/methylene tetrahydromethanopterin reductase-like flavin-dependent oxidoreductase (luciferase family)